MAQEQSGIQRYIEKQLASKWVDISDIVWDIVSISNNAMTSTPTWEVIEDYRTRLQAKKYLLELAGYSKSNKGGNINVSLTNLVYKQ